MKEKWKKYFANDIGAVQIVEATFVFPIMFIILFFLIYMGNMFYVKSQVTALAEVYAIRGANYCADPILKHLEVNDSFPSLSSLDVKPYRHLFGGNGDVESSIETALVSELNGSTSSLFKNMMPRLTTAKSNIATYHNYIIYSTFSVEFAMDVHFPIRFLGKDTSPMLHMTARAEVPVDDTAELIRNTDMVIDYFHGTKVGQAVSEAFGKINSFLSNFAGSGSKKSGE